MRCHKPKPFPHKINVRGRAFDVYIKYKNKPLYFVGFLRFAVRFAALGKIAAAKVEFCLTGRGFQRISSSRATVFAFRLSKMCE